MCGSGVPQDSPLEGHSLWDFALTTPGPARSSLYYFILYFINIDCMMTAINCSEAIMTIRHDHS